MPQDILSRLNASFANQTVVERLRAACQAVTGPVIFTSSLGLEDQVLTHFIAQSGLEIKIITLDTGRLFPQSYDLWAATEEHYGLRIHPYFPENQAVEAFVRDNGINGFYHAVEARKACCHVRKVEPLARALQGAALWITGLRADQSLSRSTANFAEADAARGLIKINPLLDWPRDQLVDFAKAEHVPVNVLHDQGFLSIGCAPCTRALQEGEPERAGRWWWEDDTKKECGLHIGPDGRLVRIPSTPAKEGLMA
jgi:phosphoadenosine phosphosulfate reductase